MGLPGTALNPLLGTSLLGSGRAWETGWIHRVQKTLLSFRGWRFALPQWLWDFRDLSHIFSPSSTHPFRVSVLLCPDYVWAVALDVPALQPSALVQSFLLCLLQKTEVLILVSCLHIGIAALWGQLRFLLSSKFNEIIFHVTQELYWFAVQLFAGLY